MTPMSSYRSQIQKVMGDLARVQTAASKIQTDYQACTGVAKASVDNLSTARGPLGKALLDDGIKNVAADGATVRKNVNEAVSRLRTNENRLHSLIGQSQNAQWQLPRSDQELQGLALALAGQPAVAALLHQARELVQISSSQHQGATRSAGWARSNAMMGEKELTQCGNAMNAVAADSTGKSVAADAAQVKFRIDNGSPYLKKQSEFMVDTCTAQGNALLCLQDAQTRLGQALEQLPPDQKSLFLSSDQPTRSPIQRHYETCLQMTHLSRQIMESDS
ncbi:hypothetical protein IV102_29680 [bacterium]|nr:hypothetical protein [bacterium]